MKSSPPKGPNGRYTAEQLILLCMADLVADLRGARETNGPATDVARSLTATIRRNFKQRRQLRISSYGYVHPGNGLDFEPADSAWLTPADFVPAQGAGHVDVRHGDPS